VCLLACAAAAAARTSASADAADTAALSHAHVSCRAAAEAAVDKYVPSNSVVAFGNGELVSDSSFDMPGSASLQHFVCTASAMLIKDAIWQLASHTSQLVDCLMQQACVWVSGKV
jgi:hypothetical protein